MKMTMAEVAKAVGSHTDLGAASQQKITSVTFDSRQLKTGGLFVPLIAARDGHDFIQNAIDNGAVGSFWQEGHTNKPTDFPVIEVPDTQQAFMDLAKYYLTKVNPRVIAITGSNGKTTTKDMIAAILKTQSNTCKTIANYNNEIGVPYTILSMDTNTENLVLEIGMDRPGQLHKMSMLAHPDIAVITMIGEAHIEFFGTRAKIADAKMEITDGLQADGVLVFNGDEPLLRERVSDDLLSQTFGVTPKDTLQADDIQAQQAKTTFQTNLWPEQTFELPLMGDYNVNNALAALLVGNLVHVPVKAMAQALQTFTPTAERTEWLKGYNGVAILSDVYNSNPTAAKEVLKNFEQFAPRGHKIVVLGDMLELGKQSRQLHAALAEDLDPNKISDVYLYGKDVQALYDALKLKYAPEHLHYYPLTAKNQLTTDLITKLQPEDMVLLKASHGLHLETVVAQLRTP